MLNIDRVAKNPLCTMPDFMLDETKALTQTYTDEGEQ